MTSAPPILMSPLTSAVVKLIWPMFRPERIFSARMASVRVTRPSPSISPRSDVGGVSVALSVTVRVGVSGSLDGMDREADLAPAEVGVKTIWKVQEPETAMV